MTNWMYLTWVSVIGGIWLIISPWVLSFSGDQPATWDVVIVGIILAVVGLFVGFFARRPSALP